MAEGATFTVDVPDLRTLIAKLKDVDPKLATGLRRELRRSGDTIIAAQRELAGAGDVGSAIGAGLRTRVTAGTTRQSVTIRSNGPRKGGANLAAVFEQATIRHPVFGDPDAWVEQPGRPYFNPPLKRELDDMRDRIADVIQDAIRKVGS